MSQVSKLLYNYKCPSVCLTVTTFMGESDFLSLYNLDNFLIFSVYIPLIYEYLFYRYFERRSVGQATKG